MLVSIFQIHGDNIVECTRAFDYVVDSLGDLVTDIEGPTSSITCPLYGIKLEDVELKFQMLPGYGSRRGNQDILTYIQKSGGRLREAADAILTTTDANGGKPLAAIEFCGALPAGNQAWQRHGRAFSFAHASVPYFYVAELGGFELSADRDRKAERMPNPAIPFSFFTISHYTGSICLPVYDANPGTTTATNARFEPVFGKDQFLEFLKLALLGVATEKPVKALHGKCLALVKMLADSRSRQDGLNSEQWALAHDALTSRKHLLDFLNDTAPLQWKKKVSIAALTRSAKRFMDFGASKSLGLTSKSLPLSFVPKDRRVEFSAGAKKIYPDLSDDFSRWLARADKHLAISWVMGFKPRGDDARPDRGLPPLTRMLVGGECDVLTFVYGPAPSEHWRALAESPTRLARSNGLWESVLAVSDGVLIDSSTKPTTTPRAYLSSSWSDALVKQELALNVEAVVREFGEQDVDTALHIAFPTLGPGMVFEGLCNPPGGDWSGISFKWSSASQEFRWLTLPRVSADGAKRPDHVFAIFGHRDTPVCLCIESKETARDLDTDIGPRLKRYTEALFEIAPSIERESEQEAWHLYAGTWKCPPTQFLSAGAYLATALDPFGSVPNGSKLDVQIAVELLDRGTKCNMHLRGDDPVPEN